MELRKLVTRNDDGKSWWVSNINISILLKKGMLKTRIISQLQRHSNLIYSETETKIRELPNNAALHGWTAGKKLNKKCAQMA